MGSRAGERAEICPEPELESKKIPNLANLTLKYFFCNYSSLVFTYLDPDPDPHQDPDLHQDLDPDPYRHF